MKLTQATAATLELPPNRNELLVFDDALSGFGFRLRASGQKTQKTWIVQYRVNGATRRTTLGKGGVLSATLAREAAKNLLARVSLGGDPSAAKEDERQRARETIASFVPQYLEFKARKLKAGSLKNITRHLTDHWKPIGKLPIHKIERRQVATRLSELAAERGAVAADRAGATLSAFFTWAMIEGLVEANPVTNRHRQADDVSRDRVLSDAELVAIWNACGDDDAGRIVRLLILTGCRRNEISEMLKSEVALGARKWTIAAERSKNRRDHEVALSDLAISILEPAMTRKDRLGRDKIFGYANVIGWTIPKQRLDKRIGEVLGAPLPDWRLHDLRRTFATRLADLGTEPHVIEALLNHISGHKAGVAGVYNRSSYWNQKRVALDMWAAHIEALLAGKAGANVIPLRADA